MKPAKKNSQGKYLEINRMVQIINAIESDMKIWRNVTDDNDLIWTDARVQFLAIVETLTLPGGLSFRIQPEDLYPGVLHVGWSIDGRHMKRSRIKLNKEQSEIEIKKKSPRVLVENENLKTDMATLIDELGRVTKQRDDLQKVVDAQIVKEMKEFETVKRCQ